MPRGETKHLAEGGLQFKPKWTYQPTVVARFPGVMEEGLLAIARWADSQENPEQAIASLLEIVKQK